ncbi:MAG: DUF1080 domain-containing protein [Candidatus Rokubacteria bacterium]|nr:DUF1080 domain-containing protein [Candidatus Rokubacteria bacterium]
MSYTWTFDRDAAGGPPEGFLTVLGTWAVTPDAAAPSQPHMLVQTARFRTGLHFPRCLVTGVRLADLVAEVAFRPLAGDNDQAGGLMFRVQDPDTYHVFRANLLDDVALFKSTGRGRRALGRFQARAEGWQRLRVEARGPRIRCYWNDRPVIEVEDRSSAEGGIGLWTISDSVSAFDDLRVEPL